jgi:hypothetical protein
VGSSLGGAGHLVDVSATMGVSTPFVETSNVHEGHIMQGKRSRKRNSPAATMARTLGAVPPHLSAAAFNP